MTGCKESGEKEIKHKMFEMQHYKNTIFINLIAVIFHLIYNPP